MKNGNKGIFITGTDTGVGKTYVACGIAKCIGRTGVDVGVMKPVETGCVRRRGKLVPSDAISLMKAARARDALKYINPYRFSKPLAPLLAAMFYGKHIDPSRIIDSFRVMSQRHDFTIVESAGGIMVPLARNYLFLDLAADLRLPVIIVARPCLGTINHTLLTISAIRVRRLKIAGVVLNYAKKEWKAGLAESTGPSAIEAISGVRILGIVQNGGRDFEGIIKAL